MFLLEFVQSHSIQPKPQKDPQSDTWSSLSRCPSPLLSFLSGTLHLSLPELFPLPHALRKAAVLCAGPPSPRWGLADASRQKAKAITGLIPHRTRHARFPSVPDHKSCAAYSPVSESPCFTYFVQISSCLQWELTIPFEIPSKVVHIHDADWMHARETCTKPDLGLIKDSEKAVGSFWSAS